MSSKALSIGAFQCYHLLTHSVVQGREMDGDFRIGEWLIQPELNRICAQDRQAQVEPKVMEVLVHLARRGYRLGADVHRADGWPDRSVVGNSQARLRWGSAAVGAAFDTLQ